MQCRQAGACLSARPLSKTPPESRRGNGGISDVALPRAAVTAKAQREPGHCRMKFLAALLCCRGESQKWAVVLLCCAAAQSRLVSCDQWRSPGYKSGIRPRVHVVRLYQPRSSPDFIVSVDFSTHLLSHMV